MGSATTQVFLSHSSHDIDKVHELRSALGPTGAVRFWVSDTDIEVGQSYASAIHQAIESSDALLVLLSPSSLRSEQVRREVGLAISRRKLVLPVVLVPGLLDSPEATGEWQYWLHTSQTVLWTSAQSVADVVRARLGGLDAGGQPTGLKGPGSPRSLSPVPSLPVMPNRVVVSSRDVPSRRRWPLVGAALVLVIGAIIGGIYFSQGVPSRTEVSAQSVASSPTPSAQASVESIQTATVPQAVERTYDPDRPVGRYKGVARQTGSTARVWEVDVVLGEQRGTVTYGRDGRANVCAGILEYVQESHGEWVERITSGTCSDGGSWTFTHASATAILGVYTHPSDSHVVTAQLVLQP